MSIGKQLRQAREAQTLSLDQAAQATHIRLHYLEALESDNFELLPSSAQVRGFLRAYADFLKLNSGDLIQALDKDFRETPAQSIKPSPVAEIGAGVNSSEAIFKEIGHKLQSQRELMGLSLEDVERHTHLRVHYIRALEEGDISHLPSPVQGKGMLSNYATFLGLNTETILLRFADGLQASLYDRQMARNGTTLKSHSKETKRVPARPSQLKRLFSMDLFVGGFLIIFLLGFIIWGAMRISALHSAQEASPTAPPVSDVLLTTATAEYSTTVTLVPSSEISPLTSETNAAPVITGTVQMIATETPIIFGATPGGSNQPVQVYVVAQQQAWMRVTVDGKIAFEGRVIPGSAYSFAGNERIDLLTGDGSGLQVYFNQQDLGFLGSFGEVVERIFTIQGVQTATPAVPLTSTPTPTSNITPTATPVSMRAPGTGTSGTASPTPQP